VGWAFLEKKTGFLNPGKNVSKNTARNFSETKFYFMFSMTVSQLCSMFVNN